jgi:hypothetical protein
MNRHIPQRVKEMKDDHVDSQHLELEHDKLLEDKKVLECNAGGWGGSLSRT